MQPVLIVTRPAPKGQAFAQAVFQQLGHEVPVILAPAFRIDPVLQDEMTTESQPSQIDHVIFTSAYGVQHAPQTKGAVAWCVGTATGQAARDAGYTVRIADGDADSLMALMLKEKPRGAIVHFGGYHRRGNVAERLYAAGLDAHTVTVYWQRDLDPPQALIAVAKANAPLIVPLFSPRSARILRNIAFSAPVHLVAISAAVAAEMHDIRPESVLTLDKPDASAMISATCRVLTEVQ